MTDAINHKQEVERHKETKRLHISLSAPRGHTCSKRIYPTIVSHSIAVGLGLMPKPVIEFWHAIGHPTDWYTKLSRDY